MDYLSLRKLTKLYFSYLELAKVLKLKKNSARVIANRYVKKGYIIRLKKNFYILREKWDNLTIEEKFALANILQVPSYISLTTALSYYGYTTQVQQNYYESVNIHRSNELQKEDTVFKYIKLNKKLYFGYIKKNNFFIALPEKAILDALYLMSRGKYKLDLSAIDFNKFNKNLVNQYLAHYSPKIRKAIINLWKF